jgi:hypothetical protein
VGGIDHVQAFGRSIDLPKEMKDGLVKCVLVFEKRFSSFCKEFPAVYGVSDVIT